MGRGGDQIPFLDKGYPAVRVTVSVEDYEHQHQDLRTEGGIKYGDTVDELDWAYLTRASVLNVRALHALAMAPMPPKLRAHAAVRVDTKLTWNAVGADYYRLHVRRTDEGNWRAKAPLGNDGTELRTMIITGQADGELSSTIGLRGDDWLFGISACNDGFCSPVSSAVPGGAFEPLEQPKGDSR
ncbi:MAG: hypothetical protein SXU28_12565 [Pseudomonadota bacterium]|nr:hypothetical protein [Pseudomonadota bacterium]